MLLEFFLAMTLSAHSSLFRCELAFKVYWPSTSISFMKYNSKEEDTK